MADEKDIFEYLARGGKFSAPGNAPARYRAELLRMMASFVDSEMAGAAGFADCINWGPGVKEKIAASRIVLEKLDHAERVLRIMGDFGADVARYQNVHPWAARIARTDDIGVTRRAGDMRLNVFHYPLRDWTDSVVMNVMMGAATVIQLGDLVACSYQPLGAAFRDILPRENRHAELGEEGLRSLAARGGATLKQIDDSITYWWPRVASTFGAPKSDRTEILKRYGLRHRSNADLLEEWRNRMSVVLASAQGSRSGNC
ncbi:MAG TPA: phenylacetate-CoA oxygenase subunit PaaI [Parvularculaceae bacterium]|nr:phenylacetate-CoA oxygenase subunit PaaI [Parvularculaceae bacterium]